MAEKHIVTVKADTKDAEDNLDNVVEKLDDTKKAADEAGDEVKKIGDKAKKARTGVSGIAAGFRKVGTAIKGMGIGLVLAAFAALSKLASENQYVMDKLSTAGNTLQMMFNDLVEFIRDDVLVYFQNLKDFFTNLTFDDFRKAIQENIMERVQSTIDMFGFLAKAVKQVFEGDFSGAMESAKEAGKEFVDTMTGVDGTVDKVVETVSDAATAVSEYTTETWEAAKATTAMSKAAQVAAAEQELLLKKYENENEILRQQRDDIFSTTEERLEASAKLKESLEEQALLMEKQAALQLANAEAQYALNQTDENYIALLEAKKNAYDVEATIQGFRSEQLAQHNALLQEQIDNENELEEDKERRRLKAEEDAKKAEEDRLKAIKDAEDAATAKINANRAVIDSTIETFNVISAFADKESALGKAVVVAQQALLIRKEILNAKEISMEAQKALVKAQLSAGEAGVGAATGFAATLQLGFPAAIPFLAAYAVAAVGIISSVMSAIKAVKGTASKYGASSGDVSAPQLPAASAPNFNIVESSAQNNQAETLGGLNQEPIKAYVVSTEMSSQQELDRKTEEEATVSG